MRNIGAVCLRIICAANLWACANSDGSDSDTSHAALTSKYSHDQTVHVELRQGIFKKRCSEHIGTNPFDVAMTAYFDKVADENIGSIVENSSTLRSLYIDPVGGHVTVDNKLPRYKATVSVTARSEMPSGSLAPIWSYEGGDDWPQLRVWLSQAGFESDALFQDTLKTLRVNFQLVGRELSDQGIVMLKSLLTDPPDDLNAPVIALALLDLGDAQALGVAMRAFVSLDPEQGNKRVCRQHSRVWSPQQDDTSMPLAAVNSSKLCSDFASPETDCQSFLVDERLRIAGEHYLENREGYRDVYITQAWGNGCKDGSEEQDVATFSISSPSN